MQLMHHTGSSLIGLRPQQVTVIVALSTHMTVQDRSAGQVCGPCSLPLCINCTATVPASAQDMLAPGCPAFASLSISHWAFY
jgi:hypothetical protein